MILSARLFTAFVPAALLSLGIGLASAAEPAGASTDPSGNPAVASTQDGSYFDKKGYPTFKISKDGTVDWNTYIGYVRYTANCMQCHGPDGMGSSYAPVLVNSLRYLTYGQFLATVAGGKKSVNSSQDLVMPSFGTNKNVMCYVNDIYVYLRARSDGALGRGRPAKHAPKPAAFTKAEDQCMG